MRHELNPMDRLLFTVKKIRRVPQVDTLKFMKVDVLRPRHARLHAAVL